MTGTEIEFTPARRNFLADVLVTAVEGGIGYWSAAAAYRWYYPTIAGGKAEPGPGNTANAWVELEPNDDEESDFEAVRIELPDIDRALGKIRRDEVKINTIMQRQIILADVTDDGGGIDADLADCVMQVAALGEIRFG